MKVEVSIIIPAYNIAPYIGRCLESVLSQSLRDIEIIVIDDGSKDNTAEIIKTYALKDERIKFIQKCNGGVTSARLAGIQGAEGEYIGFVDGDDMIEDDMFERLLNNAKQYHADISHCGYQMVFINRTDYYYNTGKLIKQDNIAGLKDLISAEFVEPTLCNKLYHRKLFSNLLEKDLLDMQIKYNEDLLMNYFLFKESHFAIYEDWCPYHYLIRSNSTTSETDNVQKFTDPMKVFKYIEKDTAETSELQYIVLKRLSYLLIMMSSKDIRKSADLHIIQRQARKELRKRLGEILRCPFCNTRNKLMSTWVSVWPWSYGKIHKIYAHITGIDKKFSRE